MVTFLSIFLGYGCIIAHGIIHRNMCRVVEDVRTIIAQEKDVTFYIPDLSLAV
jgi:hypothetical protein